MAEAYTSLTDRALTYLREKIQNCELMPGELLSEKGLCEEIGCGRTPVREALLTMKGEGLIEIFPRRGIRVTPFTRDGICQIYQIRKLIEPAVCTRYPSCKRRRARRMRVLMTYSMTLKPVASLKQ